MTEQQLIDRLIYYAYDRDEIADPDRAWDEEIIRTIELHGGMRYCDMRMDICTRAFAGQCARPWVERRFRLAFDRLRFSEILQFGPHSLWKVTRIAPSVEQTTEPARREAPRQKQATLF